MARVITFISATKGVGKTHMVVNLALQLGALGHPTCLFNSDSDTATISSLLGMHPRYALNDLIRNRSTLDNVLLRGPNNIHYFPASPGIESIGGIEHAAKDRLIRSFLELNRYDFFLLDTFPGLSRNVVSFCKASSELILVMTSEPASLKESYALLKALSVNGFKGSVMVLINNSRDVKVARRSYGKFKEAIQKHLPITLMPLGTVFKHPGTPGTSNDPFILQDHGSDTSRCIVNIAQHLVEKKAEDLAVSAFFSLFLKQLKHPFQLSGFKKTNQQDIPAAGQTIHAGSTTVAHDIQRDNEHIQDVLSRLLGRMDVISDVLGEIKEMLSEQRRIAVMPMAPAEPFEKDGINKSDQIPLDFEAYLRQRTGKG